MKAFLFCQYVDYNPAHHSLAFIPQYDVQPVVVLTTLPLSIMTNVGVTPTSHWAESSPSGSFTTGIAIFFAVVVYFLIGIIDDISRFLE